MVFTSVLEHLHEQILEKYATFEAFASRHFCEPLMMQSEAIKMKKQKQCTQKV